MQGIMNKKEIIITKKVLNMVKIFKDDKNVSPRKYNGLEYNVIMFLSGVIPLEEIGEY